MSVTRQANGRWLARWRAPDGRERWRRFDLRRDALVWVEEQRREVRRGTWVDPADGRTTVADYAESWIRQQSWRPSTTGRARSVLDVHVLPTFGTRELASVRTTDVRQWVAVMTGRLAPATVEGNYRLFAQLLEAAVTDRYLTISPARGVPLPRKEAALVVPLEEHQVDALAEAIRPDLAGAVWLAAVCGLRQGEVLGLSVDRVRWLRREIVVDRQLLTPPRGAPGFAPTKTQKSNRVVPAPDELLEALAQHVEVFEAGPDGLMFHDRGRPWRRNQFARAWLGARAAAGVEARFHDLRHYCASVLIANGRSVKQVQAVLGHASATETLDVYAHLWPDDQDRTREAMRTALPSLASNARARSEH